MLGILTIAYPMLIGGILITGGSAVILYMIIEVIRRRKNIFRATYYYKNRLIFMKECKRTKKHLINFPKEIEGCTITKKMFVTSTNGNKFYPDLEEMKLMWNCKVFYNGKQIQSHSLTGVFTENSKDREEERLKKEIIEYKNKYIKGRDK